MLVVRTPPPPLPLRRLKPSPFRCYYHALPSPSFLPSHMHLLTTVPLSSLFQAFQHSHVLYPRREVLFLRFSITFFFSSLISRLTFARFSQISQLRRLLEPVSRRVLSHCSDWAAKSRIFRVDFSPRTKRERERERVR